MYSDLNLTVNGAQVINGNGNRTTLSSSSNNKNNINITNEDKYSIASEYEQIMDKINQLSKDIVEVDDIDDLSAISDNIDALQSNINIRTTQIDILRTEISKKEDECKKIEKQIKKEEKVLKEYQDEYKAKEEAIAEINRQIEEQESIIDNSDKNTNEGLEKISDAYNTLASLNTSKSSLLGEANALNTKITEKETEITRLKTRMSCYTNLISSLETPISSIESSKFSDESKMGKIVSMLISQDEMNIVDEQNINLTEKLDDGSPRFIIAQGTQDNKFHLYDMSTGVSLARQYGENGGYNIVPEGNGYINIEQNHGDDKTQGSTCFFLNDDRTIGKFNATYTNELPENLGEENTDLQTSSNKFMQPSSTFSADYKPLKSPFDNLKVSDNTENSDIEEAKKLFSGNSLSFNFAGSLYSSLISSKISEALSASNEAKIDREKAQEALNSLDDLIEEKQDTKKN